MRRPLPPHRRFVCVPLGVLWLVVMAAIAVPVILVMTALYYLRQGGRAILLGRGASRSTARDEA
jgi:hypothetical protein